jgi:hypothetical protein
VQVVGLQTEDSPPHRKRGKDQLSAKVYLASRSKKFCCIK